METWPERRPQEPAHDRSRDPNTPNAPHTPHLPHTPNEGDDVFEARALRHAGRGGAGQAHVDFEPGWMATRALISLGSDQLLAVMVRPSFRPIGEQDVVPVWPCPYCHDGGLRTAGSVRTRRGREQVRACDTCGRVEIGEASLHSFE